MIKHTSTFERAAMAVPHNLREGANRLPIPSGPMRAFLMGTKGHPKARDGAQGVVTDAILLAKFDEAGNTIYLETQYNIFTKE
jgi:hypothetical protein